MNTHYLKRVRKHFNCGIRHIDRHNQREWCRAIRVVGKRWVLLLPAAA